MKTVLIFLVSTASLTKKKKKKIVKYLKEKEMEKKEWMEADEKIGTIFQARNGTHYTLRLIKKYHLSFEMSFSAGLQSRWKETTGSVPSGGQGGECRDSNGQGWKESWLWYGGIRSSCGGSTEYLYVEQPESVWKAYHCQVGTVDNIEISSRMYGGVYILLFIRYLLSYYL